MAADFVPAIFPVDRSSVCISIHTSTSINSEPWGAAAVGQTLEESLRGPRGDMLDVLSRLQRYFGGKTHHPNSYRLRDPGDKRKVHCNNLDLLFQQKKIGI